MIGYEVEIKGLDECVARLGKYDKIADKHLLTAMSQSVITVESAIKPLVPVGVSSRLRNSIASEVKTEGPGSIVGKVGSTLKGEKYPAVMEFGRKPGKMPPPEKLVRWVSVKGMAGVYSIKTRRRMGSKATQAGEDMSAAWGVARAIGKRGIKGHFFLKKGYQQSKGKVHQFFVTALHRITEELAGK